MSNKAFHIYNSIALLLLLVFNLLVLFAFGIGEGGMSVGDWFPIITSFFIWGIFYFIQFTRPNKTWKITWFGIMVLFLYFWETGFGVTVGRMFL